MVIIDEINDTETEDLPQVDTTALVSFVSSLMQSSLADAAIVQEEKLRSSILMLVKEMRGFVEGRIHQLQLRIDSLEKRMQNLPQDIVDILRTLPAPHIEVETKVVVPPRTSEKTIILRPDGLPEKIIDREWCDE